MCCDWSLFHSVRLERAEVPWASSKRLPLYQHDDQLSFRLPCAMLEVGEERVCGDYEHRPQACRVFECDLLERYRKGQVPRAEAFEIVARARTLIAGIEARLAKNTRSRRASRRHAVSTRTSSSTSLSCALASGPPSVIRSQRRRRRA
jgi:Fe-S-cluster containining protein